MMRMMKSLGIVVGVIAVLAALILSPMTVLNHVRATQDVVRQEVENMSPDVQEAARIRVLLRDMDQDLLEYQEKVADVADRSEAAESAANRIETELNQQKEILARAKNLLDAPQASYEIGGKTYTHDKLCADVKARLEHCDHLADQLDFYNRVAGQLRAAEQEGRENLVKAQQVKQERAAELKELEMRLANAGLLRQVNELTGQLDQSPLGPETELGKAFAQFRKRVGTAERQADYLASAAKGGMVIDWNGRQESDDELSAAIVRVLSTDRAE